MDEALVVPLMGIITDHLENKVPGETRQKAILAEINAVRGTNDPTIKDVTKVYENYNRLREQLRTTPVPNTTAETIALRALAQRVTDERQKWLSYAYRSSAYEEVAQLTQLDEYAPTQDIEEFKAYLKQIDVRKSQRADIRKQITQKTSGFMNEISRDVSAFSKAMMYQEELRNEIQDALANALSKDLEVRKFAVYKLDVLKEQADLVGTTLSTLISEELNKQFSMLPKDQQTMAETLMSGLMTEIHQIEANEKLIRSSAEEVITSADAFDAKDIAEIKKAIATIDLSLGSAAQIDNEFGKALASELQRLRGTFEVLEKKLTATATVEEIKNAKDTFANELKQSFKTYREKRSQTANAIIAGMKFNPASIQLTLDTVANTDLSTPTVVALANSILALNADQKYPEARESLIKWARNISNLDMEDPDTQAKIRQFAKEVNFVFEVNGKLEFIGKVDQTLKLQQLVDNFVGPAPAKTPIPAKTPDATKTPKPAKTADAEETGDAAKTPIKPRKPRMTADREVMSKGGTPSKSANREKRTLKKTT